MTRKTREVRSKKRKPREEWEEREEEKINRRHKQNRRNRGSRRKIRSRRNRRNRKNKRNRRCPKDVPKISQRYPQLKMSPRCQWKNHRKSQQTEWKFKKLVGIMYNSKIWCEELLLELINKICEVFEYMYFVITMLTIFNIWVIQSQARQMWWIWG